MKRKLLFILILPVLVFSGCSKQQQMPDFIPTQAPNAEDSNNDMEDAAADSAQGDAAGETDVTPTSKAVYIGETTTKYVKLKEYDAILNVRATPDSKGEVVGFLVHTEKVQVIDITDGWASFVYDGSVCYVSADFLVDTRPDYIEPPTPTLSPTPSPIPADTPTPTPKPAVSGEEDNELPPEI